MKKTNMILLGIILAVLIIGSFALILYYNENTADPNNDPAIDNPGIGNNGENGDNNNDEPSVDQYGNTLLTDHNRYLTLNTIMNDFILEVKANQTAEAYVKLLNEYVASENISAVNLPALLNASGKTYSTDQISYKQINDRIIKYNLKGYFEEDIMDENGSITEFNSTIFFDTTNMTYKIALEYDYNVNINAIEQLSNNNYSIKTINNRQMVSMYYLNIINKVAHNDSNLSQIISNYDSVDLSKIHYNGIDYYNVTEVNNQIIITLTDQNSVSYKFTIGAVLDYTVEIN